jgi:hypothetical protein
VTKYTVTKSINADQQTIWDILVDAKAYPQWNPGVLGIHGTIAEGETINLTSIVNPKREFKLKISEVNPPESMVWGDGMPFGLFKGVRTFRLSPNADGSTEFFMEEVYSGLMAPLITKTIPDLSESFEMYASGLKSEAEKRVG